MLHVTRGKSGNYSKVCISTKIVHPVETEGDIDTLVLGSVDVGLDPGFANLTDWWSGMVPVLIRNSSKCICVDYTRRNKALCRERYIELLVAHTICCLVGSRVFTKLFGNIGFWQNSFSTESSLYTTFIIPFGCFHCKILFFGKTSTPGLFKRHVNDYWWTVRSCGPYGWCLFVGERATETRRQAAPFSRGSRKLESHLTWKIESWAQAKWNSFGHILSADGGQPDSDKGRRSWQWESRLTLKRSAASWECEIS